MSNVGDGKMGPSLLGGRNSVGGPPLSHYGGGHRATDLVAEEPTMRAVALMDGPISLKDSFEVQKPGWFGGPPPKGLAPLSMKRDLKHAMRGDEGALIMKQEWIGKVAVPANWVVKSDALEKVPFPLERTHRQIYADAGEVATRIADALRLLSIEAEYDGEKAKAKCRTRDFVCFRIRLYAGGEGGLPVVVECQRRSGPSTSFMYSCRAILSAAEGDVSLLKASDKVAHPAMRSVREMKCLKTVIVPMSEEDGDNLAFALDKAIDLLRTDRHDANILGMENLCVLTDPIKTDPKSAMRAAKYILIDEQKFNIREEMTALLERDVLSPDFDQVNERELIGHAEQLRYLALLVFSNALSLTSDDGCLERCISDQQWFSQFLIPSLIAEIRNASTSPNSACVASKCLNLLMSCSAIALSVVKEYDGILVITEANQFGLRRHDLLAGATQCCMNTLQKSV